ncbi:hypothetical protein CsSME_00024834 [Camellia sinensis var. sinensis]
MSDQVGKGERLSLRAPSLLDLHICHDLMHLIPNELQDIHPIIELKTLRFIPQRNDIAPKDDINQPELGGQIVVTNKGVTHFTRTV